MARKRREPRGRRPNPQDLFRTNYKISADKIRLVGDNFEEISEVAGKTLKPDVFNTKEAIKYAQALELDLVEISPKAVPPVCKIIDYSKFLYEKKKRDKEIKSKAQKTVIKEIRFGPNTDEHDFEFKLKNAQKFLESGAKVKAFVQFRGRSIVFKDRGELLLLKFLAELDDQGSAEALPKMEGRRMFVMVAPKIKKK